MSADVSTTGGSAASAAAKGGDKGKKKPADAKGKEAAGATKPPAPARRKAATEPIIPRRGDGEYGVTKRRGEGTHQLRDVPYIQYFAAGQALHGAYWHDVFGKPRSHGCVNLSPPAPW